MTMAWWVSLVLQMRNLGFDAAITLTHCAKGVNRTAAGTEPDLENMRASCIFDPASAFI